MLKATRYEFTHKEFSYVLSGSAKGWTAIRHPAGENYIPPRGEKLTTEGWVGVICSDHLMFDRFDDPEAFYENITAPTPEEIAEAETASKAYAKVSDEVAEQIRSLVEAKKGVPVPESEILVIYSAYNSYDENDVPVNNLNEVVAEGSFTVCYDGGWGDSWRNSDKKLVNPTWLELAVYADAAIKYSGDKHHVFFEGAHVNVVGGEIDLFFGS